MARLRPVARSIWNVLASRQRFENHDEVDPALAEAVEIISADIRRTTALEPVINDEDWVQEPGVASAMFGFSGAFGERGVYVQTNAALTARLVQIADIVQDEVTDELWGAWPECPLHRTHPLAPRELSGEAVWVCPTTDQPISQIGQLEPG